MTDRGFDGPNLQESPVDPSILDRLEIEYNMYDFWSNEPDSRVDDLTRLEKLVKRLTIEDQELYRLHITENRPQKDLVVIYGLSQSNIHHKFRLLTKRLTVLNKLPEVYWGTVFKKLLKTNSEEYVRVLEVFLSNWSQKTTADILAEEGSYYCVQHKVRTVILNILKYCKANNLDSAAEYLTVVTTEGSILHKRTVRKKTNT